MAFGEKPIVWGPLLGVVLSAIGIKMPDLLLASIKPLGTAATAAALFLTGVILSARKLQLNALIATSTIVKLLVQPFIARGLVMLLGLHGSIAITAILMIAPPPASLAWSSATASASSLRMLKPCCC